MKGERRGECKKESKERAQVQSKVSSVSEGIPAAVRCDWMVEM